MELIRLRFPTARPVRLWLLMGTQVGIGLSFILPTLFVNAWGLASGLRSLFKMESTIIFLLLVALAFLLEPSPPKDQDCSHWKIRVWLQAELDHLFEFGSMFSCFNVPLLAIPFTGRSLASVFGIIIVLGLLPGTLIFEFLHLSRTALLAARMLNCFALSAILVSSSIMSTGDGFWLFLVGACFLGFGMSAIIESANQCSSVFDSLFTVLVAILSERLIAWTSYSYLTFALLTPIAYIHTARFLFSLRAETSN